MRREWRLALCGAALVFVALEIGRSLTRLDGVIFTGYTQVGEVLLQGGDPYGLPINTWPPFFLMIAAGLALASRVSLAGALLVWQAGTVAALWGSIRLLTRWFSDGGDRPAFWPRDDRLSFTSAPILVPVLMTARLVQEHLQHTQINLFVFFLCLLAFEWFRTRRTWAGGLALATAASTKAVPVLLLGYLVFRRRWAAAGWTVAFLIALNVVLPWAAFGPTRALDHWRSWRAVAAAEVQDPAPGFANQSLLAGLKRLLTVEGGTRDPVRYPVAAWSPRAVQLAFTGVAGLAALGLAWVFGWRAPPEDSRRAATEVAICLGAMTIVSPLAWKAHYVTLLASYFVAWGWLRSGARPRGAWAAWWGSLVCLTLSAPALVGGPVRGALESLNVITAGAVLVVGLALAGLHHAFEPVPGNRRDP